jgi:hypothetical protein
MKKKEIDGISGIKTGDETAINEINTLPGIPRTIVELHKLKNGTLLLNI